MSFSKFKRWFSSLFSSRFVPDNIHLIPISQTNFSLDKVSAFSLSVVQVLQEKGYDAYLVGGAVRDILIGRLPKDFDVVTSASPEEVVTFFKRARVIGRRFKIVHVMQGKEIVEVSTFRKASSESSVDEYGRLLNDNCYGSHQEDANRRDFSINGLYFDPSKALILDFHHGVKDLESSVIRVIGDPLIRYREDPVRMLRAIRFSMKLGFEINKSSLESISPFFPLLAHVPPARIFDELVKVLFSGNAWASCQRVRELGQAGILPLVDYIVDNPAPHFVQHVLSYTDARIRSRKHVSLSFLLATILWGHVASLAEIFRSQGKKPRFAFHCAIDEILSTEFLKMGVPKRFSADIREICVSQMIFVHRHPRQIAHLLEKKRFTAAYDFFVLRVQLGELDESLLSWWSSFLSAASDQRETMLHDLRDNKPGKREQVKKRSSRSLSAPRQHAHQTPRHSKD